MSNRRRAGRLPQARAKPAALLSTAPSAAREGFYTIGGLAEELGLTTRAIRFYEVKGLIAPARRGVARTYSRRDRARLKLILRGKNLGFSLEEIAQYLKLYDADPAQMAQTQMLLAHVETAIAGLQAKRADIGRTLKELQEIRAQCRAHLQAKEPSERTGSRPQVPKPPLCSES